MAPSERKLKIVFKSSFDHAIHLAKAQLEQHGIQAYIKDGQLNNTIGTAYVEQIKLMVDISDADQAIAILTPKNE